MPGQAHRAVPRLLGFAAAAFLGVVLPAFGSPDPLGNAAALRLQNAHLEAKSRSAVLSLYSLDSRIAAADSRLSGLRTRLAALRFQRTVLRRELQVARAGEEISEQELASRVRELYDQGDVSPLEVVFGASSLADAMTQLDNVQHVASLDDDMVTQLQVARTRLMTTQETLALRTRQLEQDVQAAASVEASLLDTRASRDAYIAGLAHQRDLNNAQIDSIEAAARAAQQKSTELAGSPPAATVATPVTFPGVFAGSRTLTVTITGYALPGTTSTGIPVGWGVAAVDPRVIPLGTHLYVPGYGEAVAADIGGAIIGNRVDLWFPSVSQADDWGLRTLTIALH